MTISKELLDELLKGVERPEDLLGDTRLLKMNPTSRIDPARSHKRFSSRRQRQMRLPWPAIVRDIAPRDAIERLLAVQMAATHVALIRQSKRMAYADQLPQFEAHERAYNKLARTFAAQVEALRKHRNGGKQTVVVQHLNVADGAQAVIGNVQTGGEGQRER